MKIIHLGNLCNNSYKLARFQRNFGIDADLQIDEQQIGTNDDPAWEDYKLINNYPDWIHIREKWNKQNWFDGAGRIKRFIEHRKWINSSFDLVHAQCTTPIIAQFLAPEKLVSHCLGSDVRELAQSHTIAGTLLRRAYRRSRIVFFNNVDHILFLKRLNIQGTFLPNPIDTDRFAPGTSVVRNRKYDFVVLHPSRLDWTYQGKDRSSTKGNDKLIRAFAKFILLRPKALLVLLKSGPDVNATQDLVKKLKIESNIMFMDRMKKKDFLDVIQSADLVCDQFNVGAMGGSAVEVLSCGKPLLTYLREDCARECYEELPPIYNARTEDEILKGLINASEGNLTNIGKQSRAWVEKYHDWRIVTKAVIKKYEACVAEK